MGAGAGNDEGGAMETLSLNFDKTSWSLVDLSPGGGEGGIVLVCPGGTEALCEEE